MIGNFVPPFVHGRDDVREHLEEAPRHEERDALVRGLEQLQ